MNLVTQWLSHLSDSERQLIGFFMFVVVTLLLFKGARTLAREAITSVIQTLREGRVFVSTMSEKRRRKIVIRIWLDIALKIAAMAVMIAVLIFFAWYVR